MKTEGRQVAEVQLENGNCAWAEDPRDLPTHMFRILERSTWVHIFTPEELAEHDKRVMEEGRKDAYESLGLPVRSLKKACEPFSES